MRIRGGASFVVVVALLALGGAACGSSRTPAPPSAGSDLVVGDLAPAFTLPSAQGGSVSSAEFRGHKPVLLYFSMGPG
jgi:hypothetical protein